MQKKIVKMFDSIAPRYDLANRILSLGIDKKWRKEAIKKTISKIDKNNLRILDVACGTGDMIEIWKNSVKNKKIEISGLDPSSGMLEIAKKRFPQVTFYNKYATEIPCESDLMDVISISFGIRNVMEIQKAFDEFNRVLENDGKLLILEFVKVQKLSFFRKYIDLYTNKLLPKIGGIITKNKEAYKYLSKSIENFRTVEELERLLKKSGFVVNEVKHFNFSQVTMIIAQKK